MHKISRGPWRASEHGSQVIDANDKVILEASMFTMYSEQEKVKDKIKLASMSHDMATLLTEIYYYGLDNEKRRLKLRKIIEFFNNLENK